MMCQMTEAAGVIDTLSAQTQSHSANPPGRLQKQVAKELSVVQEVLKQTTP